jgi:dolichol-phosphate mannosyltransferase
MEPVTKNKLISIVVPAYNEETTVDELARRLTLLFAKHPNFDFEAVIVENGSVDGTWTRLQVIHRNDNRFKSLRLSRNFRMDGGLTAGLHYIKGDAVVMMAADLQDPPEVISQFIEKWEQGFDVVYQIVTRREGTSLIRRMNSQIFYWLINKLTGGMMPRNVSDFRLVDARVYRVINSMEERNRFVRGLFAWVGFRHTGVPCDRPERYAGVSNAHTLKVISLAIKGILAHSYVPIKMITIVGLIVSFISFALLAVYITKAIFFGVPFNGFGTIVCIMLLMFGFLFTILGVIGEYVGLIYEEVKQRPNFVIKETLGI